MIWLLAAGILGRWFDCAVGVQNTVLRQQSLAFSYPYADIDTAGLVFVTKNGRTINPDASDAVVGVVALSAASELEFIAGESFRPKAVQHYASVSDLVSALQNDDVDVVLVGVHPCMCVCAYVYSMTSGARPTLKNAAGS